jgi:hypothetical protein
MTWTLILWRWILNLNESNLIVLRAYEEDNTTGTMIMIYDRMEDECICWIDLSSRRTWQGTGLIGMVFGLGLLSNDSLFIRIALHLFSFALV